MIPRVLIVAGSDSGGGAGIQADIKTVMALGGHATTAITAITAQNTLGVQRVMPVPVDMVVAQMTSVLDDIGTDAVKIGMLGSGAVADAVADVLAARCRDVPIVVDPVLVATSGDALGDASVVAGYLRLARMAALVTPNVPELARLTGLPTKTEDEGEIAAGVLAGDMRCAVFAKGGHRDPVDTPQLIRADRSITTDLIGDCLVRPSANDGVVREDTVTYWWGSKIATRHTHGTGCTLASAIATGLARGEPLEHAITIARQFVRDSLHAAPGFGGGHGPMGHGLAPNVAPNQVTLPLADYADSVAFYQALGLTQIVAAAPRYARFEAPNGATLSVEAGGLVGDAVVYLECDDLDARVAMLAAQGIAFETSPTDERWGWREARMRDPAGNRLCLFRAGAMRRFPPWRLPNAG